jgi:hypothetical protein
MNWFFKIIRFLKGALYYRFAIFVCLLGASFLAPQLWEGVLWLITRIINLIYQTGSVENYEFQNFSPELQDYIIGVIIIGIGVLMFVYFYKQQNKRKNENDDFLALSKLWIKLRDVYDDEPNLDDLKVAISTINVTSIVLLNTSETTINRFIERWLEDFNTIYYRLTKNKFELMESDSNYKLDYRVKIAKKLINGNKSNKGN